MLILSTMTFFLIRGLLFKTTRKLLLNVINKVVYIIVNNTNYPIFDKKFHAKIQWTAWANTISAWEPTSILAGWLYIQEKIGGITLTRFANSLLIDCQVFNTKRRLLCILFNGSPWLLLKLITRSLAGKRNHSMQHSVFSLETRPSSLFRFFL